MIKKGKFISVLTMLLFGFGIMFMGGCKGDPVSPRSTTYNLKVTDVLGVSGSVTFVETSATVATINISLVGTPAGTHPAVLCKNSVVEGGSVQLTLNPVDATGKSSTVVSTMTYSQLIAFNGFIKVKGEGENILAQGDIGGNEITKINKSYPLITMNNFGVSGNALFEKRVNGNTLLTISLTGTIAGDNYPATINLGSIATVGGGPVVKTLLQVNGTTGKSYTNLTTLNSELAITYDNWLVYDGYINVYESKVVSGVVICHGNIGSN
ncbi:MAG: hypothetical protein PHT07_22490 [Paludibacter sp.]|nr:hypothetical protein [Paludibacter sp.]